MTPDPTAADRRRDLLADLERAGAGARLDRLLEAAAAAIRRAMAAERRVAELEAALRSTAGPGCPQPPTGQPPVAEGGGAAGY